MKPNEPAEPWILWASRRSVSNASRSLPAAAKRLAMAASMPNVARMPARYSSRRPGGSSSGAGTWATVPRLERAPENAIARAGGGGDIARVTGPDAVGLCFTCRWVRTATNRRGSVFYRCARAETDPSYARYPALPMRACPGYEEANPPGDPPHEGPERQA